MGKKATILIVDKDNILVDLLVRVWSSKDISVLGSTSAEEAIRLVDVRVPDVLVVDPALPNGFSLIAAARAVEPVRTRVIALTATSEMRARASAFGVDRTVDRNRGLDALADAIQKTLKADLKFLEPAAGKVLIIDDEEAIVFMLREFLTSRGYTVSVATTAREGLARVKSETDIQVVLLDVLMPEMSGMEVLAQIMKGELRPSVIMMTAIVDRELARQALAVGASDYILKPFDFSAIESSILACTMHIQEPWWKRLTTS